VATHRNGSGKLNGSLAIFALYHPPLVIFSLADEGHVVAMAKRAPLSNICPAASLP
jgi:hypothetical protein